MKNIILILVLLILPKLAMCQYSAVTQLWWNDTAGLFYANGTAPGVTPTPIAYTFGPISVTSLSDSGSASVAQTITSAGLSVTGQTNLYDLTSGYADFNNGVYIGSGNLTLYSGNLSVGGTANFQNSVTIADGIFGTGGEAVTFASGGLCSSGPITGTSEVLSSYLQVTGNVIMTGGYLTNPYSYLSSYGLFSNNGLDVSSGATTLQAVTSASVTTSSLTDSGSLTVSGSATIGNNLNSLGTLQVGGNSFFTGALEGPPGGNPVSISSYGLSSAGPITTLSGGIQSSSTNNTLGALSTSGSGVSFYGLQAFTNDSVSINGAFNTSGNIYDAGTLQVQGILYQSNSAYFSNFVSIGQGLQVTGAPLILDNSLTVTGPAYLQDGVSITGTLGVSGATSVTSLYDSGYMQVTGNIAMTGGYLTNPYSYLSSYGLFSSNGLDVSSGATTLQAVTSASVTTSSLTVSGYNVGNPQYVNSTSSAYTDTLSTTGVYYTMTGNYVVLGLGTWTLTGNVQYGPAGFWTAFVCFWSNENGTGTSSAPTGPPGTVLSGTASAFNTSHASGTTEYYTQQNAGSITLKIASAPTTVYLDPLGTMTGTSATVTTQIFAVQTGY